MKMKRPGVCPFIAACGIGMSALLFAASDLTVNAAPLAPPPISVSSNIQGVVLSASTGTIVLAHNNTTGATFTTTTNDDGFLFTNLPAGNYTLSSLGGFTDYTVPNPYPLLVIINSAPALRGMWMD